MAVVKVESFLAEGRLRSELEARPDDVGAMRELLSVCMVKNRIDEAVSLAERLCRLVPADAEAQLSRARMLRAAGRLAEALAAAEAAAMAMPDSFAAQMEKGELAQALGDHAGAVDALHVCAQIKPADVRGMVGLATSLGALRRFDDAVHVYSILVLNTWPGLGDYLLAIADNLRSAMRGEEALAVMRAAHLFLPDSAVVADHLSRALAHAGRMDDALRECERARQLGAANFELHVVSSTAHHVAGRMGDALVEIDKALAQAPHDETAIMNRALILMAQGRWDEGWPGYDSRVGRFISTDAGRLWAGEAMDGTLLVLGEQGLGDQIQSLRYLPLIRSRVGRLVVQVAEPLLRLASCIPGVDEWLPLSAPRPAHDRCIPMMSLIRLLDGGMPGRTPVPVPFLRPPAAASVSLPDGPGFRIGLCWAGSPGYPMDTIRSMPASEAARLIRRFPLARFYRLQRGPVGPGVGQPAADLPLIDAVKDCADYADTAAVIDRLDLVISVDTSLAHVAAALGKETWILLPNVACFRWGQTGETTPLYPSVTLIRQPRGGEGWAETMDEVARRLAVRLAAYDC